MRPNKTERSGAARFFHESDSRSRIVFRPNRRRFQVPRAGSGISFRFVLTQTRRHCPSAWDGFHRFARVFPTTNSDKPDNRTRGPIIRLSVICRVLSDDYCNYGKRAVRVFILPLCELRSLGFWSNASALSASPLSSRSLQPNNHTKDIASALIPGD